MFDVCEVREKVFVYGSLKMDFGNYPVMQGAGGRFLGLGKTKPNYTLVNMGYFPAVLGWGTTAVKGQVFEVDSLDNLDSLEGHPHFYKRERVHMEGYGLVWMYVLNEEEGVTDIHTDAGDEWSVANQSSGWM